MTFKRKVLAGLGAVAIAAAAYPTAAGALSIPDLLPPVTGPVNEALALLPPELTEALDPIVADAVAQVFEQLLTLDIPGVAQAESELKHSSATALEIPGILTLGKSESSATGARATILELGGIDLLSKAGNADGGEWQGELAFAGGIVDLVRAGDCATNCLVILDSRARSITSGNYYGNDAATSVLEVKVGGEGITVLPTYAASRRDLVVFFGLCSDASTAFLASGTGTFVPLSLLAPKAAIGSLLTPCPAGP